MSEIVDFISEQTLNFEGIKLQISGDFASSITITREELGQDGLARLTGSDYAVTCEDRDYNGQALVFRFQHRPIMAICFGTLSLTTITEVAAIFNLLPRDEWKTIQVNARTQQTLDNSWPKTGGWDVTDLINNGQERLSVQVDNIINLSRSITVCS